MPNLYRVDGPDNSAMSAAINRLQDKIRDELDALAQMPLAENRRLQSVTIGTGATLVYHGLGRRIVGWFVTRQSVNTNVWESATQGDLSTVIVLQAGSTATVDLVVF